MAYVMFGDLLYSYANDVFDETVFGGPDGDALLALYNDWPNDDASELLFDIVRDAEVEAKDAARSAVVKSIEERKRDFIDFLLGRE